MPNYKGHLCGGAVAFLGALVIQILFFGTGIGSFPQLCFCVTCALFGSLFPDVDTKSRGQRYFYRMLSLVLVFYVVRQNLYAVSVCAFVALVPLLVNHRGIFHRSWFLVLVAGLACQGMFCLFPQYATYIFQGTLFFISGALSHLALDYRPRLLRKKSGRRRR